MPPALVGGSQNMLPIGTRIGEFEIVSLIGEGGFGIVYLAFDHALRRQVALKEYMPAALAMRDRSGIVSVRSGHDLPTFQAGLKSFVNEARLLAQFDHPALVKVHRFWEGNGTAYMVMPYYEGVTLKDFLKRRGTPPDEGWLKALLAPLLEALSYIHSRQCFHRDIAPDNIMVLDEGGPVLLDFGAARRVITDMAQVLTVILKPGYAPVEQYADVEGMRQGAWTDIYALAAVVYFAATGRTPMPSVARLVADGLQPMRQAGEGRYGETFLLGIDRALAVKPNDRPQNVQAFRLALGLSDSTDPVPATPVAPVPTIAKPSTGDAFADTIPRSVSAAELASAHAMTPGAVPIAPARPGPAADPDRQSPRGHTLPDGLTVGLDLGEQTSGTERDGGRAGSAPRGILGARHLPWIAAGLAAILVVALVGLWFLGSHAVSAKNGTEKPGPAVAGAPGGGSVLPTVALPTPSPDAAPSPPSASDSEAPSSLSTPPPAESPSRTVDPATTIPESRPATAAGRGDADRTAVPRHAHHAQSTEQKSAPIPRADSSPNIGVAPAQCADLLQRASLGESLTDDEKALLRRNCR